MNKSLMLGKFAATAALTVFVIGGVGAQSSFIAPGAVAPKMLTDAKSDPKEQKWSNAENFGSIPARLNNDASRECGTMGREFIPVGYHPDALDNQGKLITGGGFLCLTKETIDQVAKAKK